MELKCGELLHSAWLDMVVARDGLLLLQRVAVGGRACALYFVGTVYTHGVFDMTLC
jgi:hypothetical protein